MWGGDDDKSGALIIRGQANLLDDITAIEDLERIRGLFTALETKDLMARLLDRANHADGVEIAGSSEFHRTYGYFQETEHFVECVRTGTVPETDISYAHELVRIIDRIERAGAI